MGWFVDWYNHEHPHSAIGFVNPAQRHAPAIRARRENVYRDAKARQPQRWSGDIALHAAADEAAPTTQTPLTRY